MATSDSPDLVYLGRSRLHRNRANLIQTLHTVAAFAELGVNTRLYLPPWHKTVTLEGRLAEMGIANRPDIRPAQLLHRRWPTSAFPRFHRRLLRKSQAVYVRSHEISLALGSLGIRHHLELHTLNPITKPGQLESLIDYHQRGLIDHFFPITDNIARRLVAAGADEKRIHIAPSGVDLDAYQSVPPIDGNRMPHPRIIYLGRISYDRGLGLLIHLAEQKLGEVRLIGEQDDEIPHSLPNLHYRPTVPHREVPSLYGECELVLLPYQADLTHVDGISPMKLFEAMAAGRAIIASDIPPIREVITHGVNGMLANPSDPHAWEQAVNRLMQDPALAIQMAKQAKQDAVRYSWHERARGIANACGLSIT